MSCRDKGHRYRWSVFRIGLTAGVQGLRSHHTTALLLGFAILGAICTVFPLASLFGRPDQWLGFRPLLRAVGGGDLGLPWLLGVAGPSAAQQEAVSTLGALLLLTLWGTILIAMVTILSVGAAHSAERRAEHLVRRAVGASRRTLLAAALVEMVVVAAMPALVGSLIGFAAALGTAASWPGTLITGTGAVTVLATFLLLVVCTGILILPAIITPRRIAEGEMHQALPTFPVVFQIAVCFIVLSTGAMLADRSEELRTPSSDGPAAGTVVSISLGPETARQRSAQFSRLLAGLEAAGMRSISLSSPGVVTGLGHVAMVLTDCGQCTEGGLNMSVRLKPVTHKIVSADTFRLLGLPVLEGRGITPRDDWNAPRVAVVSRSLAGREFQDGKPIGRRIHTGDDDVEGSMVVGVVDDQLPMALGGTLQPLRAVYVSVLQHPPRTVDLLIRDPVDHEALVRILEATIGRGAGHYTANSERAIRDREIAPVRWFGLRFQLQGWALAGLSLLGVVAFMGLWVRSLVGEIAVRRSLGARRNQILRWVVWRATGIAAKGIIAGIWFGLAIWTTLPTAVAGAVGWDPLVFLRYAVLILGAVLCGVALPAWRVSRALPMELLQSPGG